MSIQTWIVLAGAVMHLFAAGIIYGKLTERVNNTVKVVDEVKDGAAQLTKTVTQHEAEIAFIRGKMNGKADHSGFGL